MQLWEVDLETLVCSVLMWLLLASVQCSMCDGVEMGFYTVVARIKRNSDAGLKPLYIVDTNSCGTVLQSCIVGAGAGYIKLSFLPVVPKLITVRVLQIRKPQQHVNHRVRGEL